MPIRIRAVFNACPLWRGNDTRRLRVFCRSQLQSWAQIDPRITTKDTKSAEMGFHDLSSLAIGCAIENTGEKSEPEALAEFFGAQILASASGSWKRKLTFVGCVAEVRRHIGTGLVESAYEQCLADELSRNRIAFQLQFVQPVQYKDDRLDRR
jgi:hypothetical protein